MTECRILTERRGKRLIIFSDGARKHFKQKYSLCFMGLIGHLYGIRIEYNFYVSYHGMNSCDAAGSHGKQKVEWWLSLDKWRSVGNVMVLAEIVEMCKNHTARQVGIYREINKPTIKTKIPDLANMHQLRFSVIPHPQRRQSFKIRVHYRELSASSQNGFNQIDFTYSDTDEIRRVFSNVKKNYNKLWEGFTAPQY